MRFVLLLLGVLSFASGPALANTDVERQRALFLDVWERLSTHESVDVHAAAESLDGYVLTPYLYWRDLRSRSRSAGDDEFTAYFQRYPDLPGNDLLRSQRLHQLGHDRRWQAFLSADEGQGGATLACYRLRALQHGGGVTDSWVSEAQALWAVGHSQPNACDPVFQVLYDGKLLSSEIRWARLERIMLADNRSLARALRRRLDADQQGWLDAWLAVAAKPAARLQRLAFDHRDPRGQVIIENGLLRLAVQNRPAASRLLEQFSSNGQLEAHRQLAVARTIALRAAWSRDANARELLGNLPEAAVDDQVGEWIARLALVEQDWRPLIDAIQALSAEQQGQSEWRYWYAEALRRIGLAEASVTLFAELAGERHYYGFLAADRLNLPYAMNHRPSPVDAEALAALQGSLPMQRAREFHALGMVEEGRREWFSALAGMTPDEQRHAAILALRMGWYDRAVLTANRAGLHDDLDLRFPLALSAKFQRHARDQGVDLALAYAISRKESAFAADARSPVGALGLMQLMPGTGRLVARQLGLPAPSGAALTDPDVNLQLGNAYLASMLKRFHGNLIMAAASYNAGPGRVDGWRRDSQGLPGTVWVENITYGETRDYVKSVLAFRAVYDWHLSGEARRLASVMPIMPGPDEPGAAYALHADGLDEASN